MKSGCNQFIIFDMDFCQSELQQKLTTLRRTNVPKTAVEKENSSGAELFKVKLKSTQSGEKNSNVNKTMDNPNGGNNGANINHGFPKQKFSIMERTKVFENGSPAKPPVPGKPNPAKKPAIGVKPKTGSPTPINASKENKEVKRYRPPSVVNKPKANIEVSYKDTRVPELAPLPPLHILGKPPDKPPKLWPLKPSLQKYLGTSHPLRPVVSENHSEKSENNEPKSETLQDGPPIPEKPVKSVVNTSEDETREIQDTTSSAEDISTEKTEAEDFYDDTAACTNNLPIPTSTGETFGEDLYEPVTNQAQEQFEGAPVQTPSSKLPTRDQSKDDKKKKEKERKRKEKEEKEREEKERKKKEKEKEKKLNEMKKKFSVRGNEKPLGTCCAAEDIVGNKMEIAASIGEEFDIIRKGKPNPSNKWLVRNSLGQYGFIDINKIENYGGENGGEDLYEEVPAFKKAMQTQNSASIPAPPSTAPPPPPGHSPPKPPSGDQELYDDVSGAGNDGEELYELLPENQ